MINTGDQSNRLNAIRNRAMDYERGERILRQRSTQTVSVEIMNHQKNGCQGIVGGPFGHGPGNVDGSLDHVVIILIGWCQS